MRSDLPNNASSPDQQLPIRELRDAIREHLGKTPIVLSAPTGTGKSTEVPRYCPGQTLVVEPRRVACRGLAMRVAELTGCDLGGAVGYRVRDDDRSGPDTRVLFATPGMALRMAARWEAFDHIILDEFHERGLETDLLMALLLRRLPKRLMVMSATLEAGRLTEHLQGVHLSVQARTFPIEIEHIGEPTARPDPHDLVDRVQRALRIADSAPGDILIFLPGKAEIAQLEASLGGHRPQLAVLPLHGGLSLDAQARVFAPAHRRKVILTTNVAETSITVPGVGVVIDSGLVRRTRYHHGRSYLALSAIAADSATQRAGRAGRTRPGLCLRLWGKSVQLEGHTPPEIHRESLSNLCLAAGLCGARVEDLPFLDPPKAHALGDAHSDLQALGAIDEAGAVTSTGKKLFGLPLDPGLGRVLIEAAGHECLEDAVDLAAALAVDRPLFLRPDPDDDPLDAGQCDVARIINGLRLTSDPAFGLSPVAVREARRQAAKLRAAFGLSKDTPSAPLKDRKTLALTAMRADPRCVHIVRIRKRHLALSNGGTEVEVARESLLHRGAPPTAVLVLGTHGVGDAHLRTRLLATCVMPIDAAWILEAGLTHDRLAGCRVHQGRLRARVEKVFAKRVLGTEETTPQGTMAREGLAKLVVEGRLWRPRRDAIALALEQLALALRLRDRLRAAHIDTSELSSAPASLEAWLLDRLETIGFDNGEDLPLIGPDDIPCPTLPEPIQVFVQDNFPLRVDLGDAGYRVEYDLGKRRALLRLVRGNRASPPTRGFLPRLPGLTIFVEAGGRLHLVK